jgi:DNA-binding LacI/PurR family transcriptional regulator
MSVGINPAVRGAGMEGFREIWSAPQKPDGLLILDDMLFADAQLAIMEMGVRVPDELRLVVLTTRNASPTLRLPLTAFETDPAEMAAELVALLRQQLAGELPKPVSRILPFREIPSEKARGARENPEPAI